jgi:hypothetical protein
MLGSQTCSRLKMAKKKLGFVIVAALNQRSFSPRTYRRVADQRNGAAMPAGSTRGVCMSIHEKRLGPEHPS